MRLSSKPHFGIKALLYMANQQNRNDTPIRVADIAKAENINARYLEQIMQALKKYNLITSVRGVQGGYTFSKPISKISLYDVVMALDGDIDIFCTDDKISGKSRTAADVVGCVHWTKAQAIMVDYLKSITLSQVFQEYKDKLAQHGKQELSFDI